MNNVAEYLQFRADLSPNLPAIIDPQNNITKTFTQLHQESNGIAQKIFNKGIRQGTRTLLMLKPSAELVTIVFALFKIGAIPIIIDPGMGFKNFLSCIKTSAPHVLISTPLIQAVSRLFFPRIKKCISINSKFLQTLIPQSYFSSPKISDSTPAAILFTSGSTGAPKGVCYTHKIFNAQLASIRDNFDISPGEVDLPMLPIFALFNPALGMTTLIPEMNPSRPASVDPRKIVNSIITYQATNSFGSPVLWHKIADYCESNNITLPSVKRIFMAGCSVPIDLIKRYQKIIPNGTVHTPYGATEALPITSISTNQILNQNKFSNFVRGTCLGAPLPHNTLKIIKISDSPIQKFDLSLELTTGEIGEIIVKGPVVTQEYLHLPEATNKSKIYEESNVWHRMGDLGFIDEDGLLWFCGRKIERVETPLGILFTDCCENIINQHPLVYRSALISLKKSVSNVPAIIIEPYKKAWPRSKKEKELFLNQIKEFAHEHPLTATINDFFLYKKFPVDVRHNAKIHRLTLAKYFSK